MGEQNQAAAEQDEKPVFFFDIDNCVRTMNILVCTLANPFSTALP
jgi:hypothetical protein